MHKTIQSVFEGVGRQDLNEHRKRSANPCNPEEFGLGGGVLHVAVSFRIDSGQNLVAHERLEIDFPTSNDDRCAKREHNGTVRDPHPEKSPYFVFW